MANKYTIQELVEISKGTDEELKDSTYEFGIFSNSVAQRISAVVGFNIIEAVRLIKPYGIDHIRAAHGKENEIERGQIPVTDQDFDLVPIIIHEYDTYVRAANNKRGDPGIYFMKTIGEIDYTVCMTFTQKRDRNTGGMKKKLTVTTMFKKPTPKKNRP
jgi:hypothetical protein